MAQMAPPRPPGSARVTYDDGMRRVQFRLWQIVMTAMTLLITGWFMTFGIWAAVLALMVAKHVLVAILAVGMHLPDVPARPIWDPKGCGDPLT